jgi:hypothetical protein
MKTAMIRTFVAALVLVGIGSTSAMSSTKKAANAPVNVKLSSVIGTPAPLCAPSDPTHCGMD